MESQSTTQIQGNNGQGPVQTRLVDVKVETQNDALQLIVTFLNLAQKRGAFTLDESAKIWDCVQHFRG